MSEPQEKRKPRKRKKSGPKAPSTRGIQAARTREARRLKALHVMPIEKLMAHLELIEDDRLICPFCGTLDTLSLDQEKSAFKCACGKTGNSISLVRKCRDLTTWKAIAYLESLTPSTLSPLPAASQSSQPAQSPLPAASQPSKSKPSIDASKTVVVSIDREPFRERVDRVKRLNPIETVIRRETGATFKRVGSNLVCRCPFRDHEDVHPSFTVACDKQWYICFGCGRKGDVIAFVTEYRSISFREALDHLDVNGIPIAAPPTVIDCDTGKPPVPCKAQPDSSETSTTPSDTPTGLSKARQKDIMTRCRDYFHQRLPESDAGQAFLRGRGLWSPDLVGHFKLGFDDGKINQAITPDVLKDMSILGLINDKSNSRFYQCLTVGLQDGEGNVIGLYGRRIETNKASKHQFPRGKITGILNADAFRASKDMIISEGALDAFAIWVMGWRNVSCIFSASSIPSLLIDQLIRYGIERVYLALDNDSAGEKACAHLVRILGKKGITVYRPKFPDGIKDANELLLRDGKEKAKADFKQMLADARPMQNAPAAARPVGADIPVTVKGDDIEIRLGSRVYRIRGLEKNLSYDVMRVNIRVSTADHYHIDTLDLYHARHRSGFIKTVADELAIKKEEIKRDLGRILLKLEGLQEKQINGVLTPEKPVYTMSEPERDDAIALLKDPKLLERIVEDFEYCGLIGEKINAQVGYICATSRKLDDPLALIIQSSSAAGKTTLMDSILEFMPPEDCERYTAITGQSLFYMGEKDLVHKILAISEEEGMEHAKYAIKTMQSEKCLRIASTGKNSKSGKLSTHQYKVDGPMQPMLTTSAPEIDPELQNRCIILGVDENRAQTGAIQNRQRESQTLSGMLRERKKQQIIRRHQNAQRLLKPIMVVNPYAHQLTFLDNRLRMRRDHMKYLTMIQTIAFLHQYQRPQKTVSHQGKLIPYIEVKPQDIKVANELANQIMGTSLDELAPQTRKLLGMISKMVEDRCKEKHTDQSRALFTRRDVREYTGWRNTQLKIHLDRLVDLEYLLVRHGRNGQRYVYELLYQGEGDNSEHFKMGLIDIDKLIKDKEDDENNENEG